MVDFLTRLEENARNQNRAPLPTDTSNEDLLNRGRLLEVGKIQKEKERAAMPTYASSRKLFNNETSQSIIADKRDKTAFELRQASTKIDQGKLKEDLDGIFGGQNAFSRFFLGSGIEDKNLGKETGIFEELGNRGVLGFFTGELLRSTPESEANLYEVLLDSGATPEEAFRKAQSRVAGETGQLTAEETAAVQSYEAWDTAFKFLDGGFLALDVATLGVAGVVRPILKSSARKGIAPFIKEASTMTNRNDLRKLVAESFPDLKGSEELEKMLDVVEEYPKDFSLLGARQDFQKTDSFNELARTVNPTPVNVATEAQQIIYKDGVPTLRKSTPDSVLLRRDEALEAIKGRREDLRLSNADVLQQEIKAGSLAFKTTADDLIDIFRVAPRGRRLKNGEEVSLSEDFAKSVSEGASVTKTQVPLADLVRLSDGSFTFAPERLIKDAPVLKFPTNLSKTVVKGAEDIDAKRVAKQLSDKKAASETKAKAATEAEKKLMEPVRKAQARLQKLQEAPVKIKADAQKNIVDIKKARDIAIKGKTPKQVIGIKAKADKEIIDVRITRDLAVKAANKEVKGSRGEIQAILKKATEKSTADGKDLQAIRATGGPAKKTTTSKSKESMKPVGEGEIKESALYESTQKGIREQRKNLGDTINTNEYEFYRTASNKDQIAKASAYIAENGVEQTITALKTAFRTGGDAANGILNNSLLITLEPELLKGNVAKHTDALLELSSLMRLSSRQATRLGQEIQMLSMLDRNNPLAVLARLQNAVDGMVDGGRLSGGAAKKGSREAVEKEVRKVVDSVDAKKTLMKQLDANICKV
mgnify:CR=1 FL=1